MENKHGVVNIAKTNTMFNYQAWPTVCKDENGVLYTVCSGFRVAHVCPFGKTVMYKSYNGGETWSSPIVINDTWLDDRDAGIVYMGEGRMLVSCFSHPADVYLGADYDDIRRRSDRREAAPTLGMLGLYPQLSAEEGHGGSFVIISEDYGNTWSYPIKVPVSAPHGPNLCADGSLIYLGREMYSDGELPVYTIAAYRSTDGGYSWKLEGIVKTPDELNPKFLCEPHVLELPGGRLLGVIRQSDYSTNPHTYTMFSTFSDDGGKTWSPLRNMGTDGMPPHLMLHSSGAVICSYGRRYEPYGEFAVVSFDGGETWPKKYTIFPDAPDPDLGYPSSVELPDGKILTVYYQKPSKDKKCSILQTIWEL